MTKSQLIESISQRFPQLSTKDTEFAVAEILRAISKTLATGNRVEIRGFGSFQLNYRPARIARNPMTGETFPISGKFAPHFKAGKELASLVKDAG